MDVVIVIEPPGPVPIPIRDCGCPANEWHSCAELKAESDRRRAIFDRDFARDPLEVNDP